MMIGNLLPPRAFPLQRTTHPSPSHLLSGDVVHASPVSLFRGTTVNIFEREDIKTWSSNQSPSPRTPRQKPNTTPTQKPTGPQHENPHDSNTKPNRDVETKTSTPRHQLQDIQHNPHKSIHPETIHPQTIHIRTVPLKTVPLKTVHPKTAAQNSPAHPPPL